MVEFGKELHFGQELFFYLLGHLFFLEDFDGPFFFWSLANGPVDVSKTAFTDFFLKFVVFCDGLFGNPNKILNVNLDIFENFFFAYKLIERIFDFVVAVHKGLQKILIVLIFFVVLLTLFHFKLLEFDKLLESVELLEKIKTIIFNKKFELFDFPGLDHFFRLWIFSCQCLYLQLRSFGNFV